jgi:hypothetical protein
MDELAVKLGKKDYSKTQVKLNIDQDYDKTTFTVTGYTYLNLHLDQQFHLT